MTSYSFGSILNAAEIVVTTNVKKWLTDNSIDAFVEASQFIEMYDDKIFGISRAYPAVLEKLPYVIVNIPSVTEANLSFGRQGMGILSKSTIIINSMTDDYGGVTIDALGKKMIISSKANKKSYTIDFPGVLFEDATAISIEDFILIGKNQVPKNWHFSIENDQVVLNIYNDIVDIYSNGLTNSSGIITPTIYDHKLITLTGTLNFSIGAESEVTRSLLNDLLLQWLEKVRESTGIISSDTNQDVSLIVASPFTSGGENEIGMGNGDALNLLYVKNFSGTVMIEGQNVSGRELTAVTKIDPLLPSDYITNLSSTP